MIHDYQRRKQRNTNGKRSPVGWKRKRDEKIYRTHYYGTATVVLGEEKMNDPIGRAV